MNQADQLGPINPNFIPFSKTIYIIYIERRPPPYINKASGFQIQICSHNFATHSYLERKMAKAMIASQPLLSNHSFPVIKPYTLTSPLSPFRFFRPQQPLLSPLISTTTPFSLSPNRRNCSLTRPAARRKPTFVDSTDFSNDGDSNVRRLLQVLLWGAEAVYILWLFLLPYAPVSFNRYFMFN